MLVRWLLAALHLLAYGFALASILRRTWSLRRAAVPAALRSVFRADTRWGLSAAVLVATGLLRLFSPYEKGADYYVHEPLFHVMALLVIIIVLEVPSMLALMRWRASIRKGEAPDLHNARRYAHLSVIQTVLLVLMVFAATGMARGIGLPSGVV
ncbi:MAG: Predicted membrane protein [uncultured Paraburkholderia sp.]|nr:MAG: Predicted membrane protein [uncultured Paraburkholderia sp.]CAH2773864.1 MAG: Predicted membrane protein [uncultured Paraburkholderia sp.]CAH2907974.1 MAG: Predicted membrane protein [uncultured Paraburkholderia sp.]CAH2908489.1 MAG: Predicted membrane protein [uncultured Paraburkholderia sp.]